MSDNRAIRRRTTARAAAVATAAALITRETAGGSNGVHATADTCMLVMSIAVLCAALCFYVQWHIGQDQTVAWLVTATAAFALQELNWFTMILGDAPDPHAQSAWVGVFQVVVTAGLGILVLSGDRLPVRQDPLASGLLIGLVVILARLVLVALPLPTPTPTVYALVFVLLGAVGLLNAARLYWSRLLTTGLRHQLAAATAFLAVGQAASTAADAPVPVLFVGIVGNAVGGLILVVTAAGRARQAVVDETLAVRMLRRRLEAAEIEQHTDQARLHEVRSTLAGIATATDLLHRGEINPARRDRLHDMTTSELRRLERLVCDTSAGTPGPIELDATMRPVIVRHRAAGLPVLWQPSGHVAIARADDVAEILNVLLSNARRHAGDGRVMVEVHEVGRCVEMTVRDHGPGVDAEVRRRLFAWGARRSGSPGEGVGLAAARLLAEAMGGDLRLDPTSDTGARFVLSLAAAEAVVAEAAVAAVRERVS